MMETQENDPTGEIRRTKWESTMSTLDAYGSREGEDVPIDDGIKECVAALNILGMKTTMSCAGHPEEDNMAFPAVQGILEDDPSRSASQREDICMLLGEFNAGRSGPFTLHLNPAVSNGFRIESAVEDEGERMMVENESGFDRERMKELKVGAQEEFQAFTEFLKRKI